MVTSPKIAIEWIPLARLHLSPRNPRINDTAVEPVAASIRRFGWRQPIVALAMTPDDRGCQEVWYARVDSNHWPTASEATGRRS